MTDAHCHISEGNAKIREFLIGRDFLGVHPWAASKFAKPDFADWLARLKAELLAHPNLGVGEIGLDRLKERTISPWMREVFESQLRLALELSRPVVLHGAKCWGQVVKIIESEKLKMGSEKPLGPFLFHGFSRSDGLLPDIVALNGYISVGPAVLNDHAVNYRELVKKIPLDRLLVETDRDCPVGELLNPLTHKPLVIREVLEKTAEIRGLTADELERVTDENSGRWNYVREYDIIHGVENSLPIY